MSDPQLLLSGGRITGMADGIDATDGASVGQLAKGLHVLRSETLTFDTPSFNDGVAFTETLPVGALILDAWIFVPTAFDGTTPSADIGLFQGAGYTATHGIWVTPGTGPIDLSVVDSLQLADGTLSPLQGGSSGPLSQLLQNDGDFGYLPCRVTNAGPLYVVASQDAVKGGAALDSTQGALIACVLVDIP